MFENEQKYIEYLKKNEINREEHEYNCENKSKYFSYDKEGRIRLDLKKCAESSRDMSRYSTPIGWYMLPDGNMILIKNVFGDVYRNLDIEDYYISKFNPIIMPQIAKQFKLKSAKYYWANDEKRGKRLTYILTTNFLNEDEELIEGDEVLQNPRELNIEKILKQIEFFCKNEKIDIHKIISIRNEFLKQTIFNKFIKQSDEINSNWGIIKDGMDFRMAPLYDFDCSCDINKSKKYMRIANNNSTELKDTIIQYQHEKWIEKYIKDVINGFEFESALESAEKETKVKFEEKIVNRYRKFFKDRICELEQIYNEVFESKER